MSLFAYLFRHSEWDTFYNCSLVDVNSVPFDHRARHPIAAHATIVLASIYYLLYIPVIHSFWKQQKGGNSCCRLLFYITCMNLGILWNLGFLHSYFALNGVVFCMFPLTMYFAGLTSDFFMVCETTADLILAMNRCVDILSPELSQMLFEGRRIWIWLTTCTLYGAYWLFFVNPAVSNSIYFAYFFNPFEGYIPDNGGKYHPLAHTLHDWIIAAFLLPGTYVVFIIGVHWKIRNSGLFMSRQQWMTFIQVLSLSLLNFTTALIYVLMQIVPLGEGWIVLGEFAWFHIHGFPPVIFLALNQTVHQDCVILFHRIFYRNRVHRISGITVIDPKTGLPVTTTLGTVSSSHPHHNQTT